MNNKPVGELGEAAFHVRALKEHLVVSKPYGDSTKYDFVVDATGVLYKIQIKATATKCKEGKTQEYYKFSVCHGSKEKRNYQKEEVDFIICYVIPEDIWYVFPLEVLTSITVKVRPWASTDEYVYEQYKEAWHLIK